MGSINISGLTFDLPAFNMPKFTLDGVKDCVDNAYNAAVEATDVAYHRLALTVDGAKKLLSATDGQRAVSNLAMTIIQGMEFYGAPVASGLNVLLQSLKSGVEIINFWNFVPRIHGFFTKDAWTKNTAEGCPNVVRLISQIAFLVQELFTTYKALEKFALIAVTTGPVRTVLETTIPIVGFIAVVLDLGDAISIVTRDGISWEQGLIIAGDLGRLAMIAGGVGSLAGIVGAGTRGIVFLITFIRKEYVTSRV